MRGMSKGRDAGSLDDGKQRIAEREQHRDAEADDERRVDQAEQQEHLALQLRHDDREIDVHALPLREGCRKDVTQAHWMTESSGLLNANNIAMPRPMMNDASIRPSSRNTLPCSCGMMIVKLMFTLFPYARDVERT